MPSNTELNAGSGGDVITTKQRTHDGDTTLQQVVSVAGVTGTEDSYTHVDIASGGGVEAAALRVTVASDSTGVLSVDDNGGSLTVDGTVTETNSTAILADTANMDTNLGTIAGAVSGTEMQVDVLTMPTTTVTGSLTVDLGANNDVTIEGGAVLGTSGSAGPANAISIGGTESGGTFRELAVDSSGNLQVDIVSGGTAGTEYSEDAATPATIVGGALMMERDDALATLTPVEGDWAAARCDANGALWVNVSNADGTSAIDTAAGGTDTGAVMLAVRDDSLTTLTPADGDYTHLRVSSTGALHVTGGGGGTEYTEDAVAAADPVGNAQILVREDSPVSIAADGDNVARRGTQYGAAYTQIVDSSGNFIDTFGGSGGTSSADDADFTAGTTLGTIVQGVYESSPTSVTDGDVGAVGITSTRSLKVEETNSAAILADTANIDTNIGTIAGDTTSLDGKIVVGAGTEAGAVRVTVATDSTGVLSVDDNGSTLSIDDGAGSITVDNGGTFATQVNGAALTALQLIDNPIVAHDAAATGSTGVNMSGARATNSVEGITQVANGDATRIQADLNGVLLTRPHTTLEENISERISDTGGTSTAFTNFAAGGAGIHNYVCDVTITNTSATDGYVDLRDGAAGSIIWTFPAPANSGATHSFSLPLKGAANTALAYDVSAALTTVYIAVNGFQAQG